RPYERGPGVRLRAGAPRLRLRGARLRRGRGGCVLDRTWRMNHDRWMVSVPGRARVHAVLRVWRHQGWRGVARRVRAKFVRRDPFAPPPVRKLKRPALIEIGGQALESFAAGIRLPAVTDPLV